jgi:hypothetical protein
VPDGRGPVTVTAKPAPGRERISFVQQKLGNHRYVIPSDAIPLLSAGKLDKRLFDVDELMSLGYLDGKRTDTPLIIQHEKGAQPKLAGATGVRELAPVSMRTLKEPKSTATSFWNSAKNSAQVKKIWLDGRRKLTASDNMEQIGAPTAWKAGIVGAGTTTAVLDSGIDATHPDFAGKIFAQQNFTDTPDIDDTVGHGTHVASIIAGSGAASDGKYQGAAPGTKLAIGKVCDVFCPDSAIIAGMVWAAVTVRAKVVNLSLGGWDTPGDDPMESMLNELSAQYGTLFVVAAGNDGIGGVNSPGSAAAALTVAAVDGKDATAEFSSRGPRHGDLVAKPDISAPGVGIIAAKAAHGRIGSPTENPQYVGLDGTSMATPHVAGAAAVLAGQHPDWTGQQIKNVLMASAKTTSTIFEQGAGRLNLGRAISQPLAADPPSISVSTQLWPHTDDAAVNRELKYHNYGKTPLTLTLSTDVRGPSGKPAPDGMFTVTPKTVTVAPGEDTSVTVVTNTRIGTEDGQYAGRVTATATDFSVSTPIAVHREVRSYNLTVTAYDRQGGPAKNITGSAAGLDAGTIWQDLVDTDLDGTITARLPYGRYGVGEVIGEDSDEWLPTQIDAPQVTIDRDVRLIFDARKTKPVQVSVDRPDARLLRAQMLSMFAMPDDGYAFLGAGFTESGTFYSGSVGKPAPRDDYVSTLMATLADPGPTGDFVDSPYAYRLASFARGRMPTGIQLHGITAKLARLDHRVAGSHPDDPLFRESLAATTIGSLQILLLPFDSLRSSRPGTVPQYLTPGTIPWAIMDTVGLGTEQKPRPDSQHIRRPEIFQARTYAEQSDAPVIGLGFQPGVGGFYTSVQYPDALSAVPLAASGADPRYAGRTYGGTRHTVLYRDGKQVAQGDYDLVYYEAPAADAAYRLETTQEPGLTALSTKISGEWNFRGKATTNQGGDPLPLFSPRFAVKEGKAPAGKFDIPVTTDQQIAGDTISAKTVEFSVDDGKTWKPASVRANGKGAWVATVDNPGSGFVSLRGNAADNHGNTGKVTIIRAYQISG